MRINREGTPLNRSDLIFSMLKLNWKESAEALPDFVHRVNKGNSLELETDFVIRCLFAVSNLGAKFELDHLRNKKNVQKLRENFDGCCNAIKATVDSDTANSASLRQQLSRRPNSPEKHRVQIPKFHERAAAPIGFSLTRESSHPPSLNSSRVETTSREVGFLTEGDGEFVLQRDHHRCIFRK